jgi:hypothetical protein
MDHRTILKLIYWPSTCHFVPRLPYLLVSQVAAPWIHCISKHVSEYIFKILNFILNKFFYIFLNCFDVLILKIIFKKIKNFSLFN